MSLNISENHIRIRLKEQDLNTIMHKKEFSEKIFDNNKEIFSYHIKLFEEQQHKILIENLKIFIYLPKFYLEQLPLENKKKGLVINSINSFKLTLQLDIF